MRPAGIDTAARPHSLPAASSSVVECLSWMRVVLQPALVQADRTVSRMQRQNNAASFLLFPRFAKENTLKNWIRLMDAFPVAQ